ncbi:MAG: hypothetical protein JWR87_376 [Segetibacter sp.]|nr:hypothetical protein [Segetibacter sp.]
MYNCKKRAYWQQEIFFIALLEVTLCKVTLNIFNNKLLSSRFKPAYNYFSLNSVYY